MTVSLAADVILQFGIESVTDIIIYLAVAILIGAGGFVGGLSINNRMMIKDNSNQIETIIKRLFGHDEWDSDGRLTESEKQITEIADQVNCIDEKTDTIDEKIDEVEYKVDGIVHTLDKKDVVDRSELNRYDSVDDDD